MNIRRHIIILSIIWAFVFIVLSYVDPKSLASKKNHHETNWSYEGRTGPVHWDELDPTFSACEKGTIQSPINIETANLTKENQKAHQISINYHPTNLTVINNGHTIQAVPLQQNHKLVIDNNTYLLEQFHFHSKSEHQIDGKHYPIELHLVHKSTDGKLAVLGVMIREGKENKAVSSFWNMLPTSSNTVDIRTSKNILISDLIPDNQSSFQYIGSLTTPPCTEGVNWFVFKEPIEMSREQIDKFSKIFPANNRPIQPIQNHEIIFVK